MGKHLQRPQRKYLMPLIEAYADPMQCGGMAGRSTDFAVQTIRSMFLVARKRKLCAAVFFLDIKEAVYAVIRETLMEIGTDDDAVVRILRSLSLPPSAFQDFACMLEEALLLEKVGAPEHLHGLLSEAHSDTWWVLQGCAEAAHATRGTCPGRPLADAVFNLAYAERLRQQREVLLANDLGMPVDEPTSRTLAQDVELQPGSLTSVAYTDDGAHLAVATAAGIIRKAATVAAHAIDVFASGGLRPNLLPGKLSFLFQFAGPGSRAPQRALYHDYGGEVCVTTRHYGAVTVQAKTALVHLGVTHASSGSMAPEIAHRLSSARHSARPLRRHVFTEPALELAYKRCFLQALVYSMLLYNAATWHDITTASLVHFNAFYMGLLRTITGTVIRSRTQAHRATDAEVCVAAEMVNLPTVLGMLRQVYLPRLIRHGPPLLLGLLHELRELPHSWMRTIQLDLQWLHEHASGGPRYA